MKITDRYSGLVPRDPAKNVEWRLRLLRDCGKDRMLRRGVMEACRVDPVFWFNAFLIQSNPIDRVHKVGPFICYDHQAHSIRQIVRDVFTDGEDHGIEKSRNEGASWAAMGVFIWVPLFHRDEHLNAISHTEKAVDNGPNDSKSLFWKGRFILKHLPEWMTLGASGSKLSFEFPHTNSSFIGEASTARSTVGGRGPCLLDEVGKMMNADEILSNTQDVGPRLVVSTHYDGRDGDAFARFISKPSLRKSVWHWSMNPNKNKGLYRVREEWGEPEKLDPEFDYEGYSFVVTGKPGGPFKGIRSPWYDHEAEKRSSRDMAKHLDIDREGASSQFFDSQKLAEIRLINGAFPKWEGDVLYDRSTGALVNLSKRSGGNLKLWTQLDYHNRPRRDRYVIGVDPADGQSANPSCVSIASATLCEKVAEFSDARIGTIDLAAMVYALGHAFATEDGIPALVAWETNGPGGKFGTTMAELKYGNRWRRVLMPPDVPVPTPTEFYGWHCHPRGKLTLLENYRDAIETRRFINRSFRSLDECAQFVFSKKTGKLEHSGAVAADDGSMAGENHADMVIADMIVWMLCLQVGSGYRHVEKAREVPVGSMLWRREYAEHQRREREDCWDSR